jgi:hypothetical protein
MDFQETRYEYYAITDHLRIILLFPTFSANVVVLKTCEMGAALVSLLAYQHRILESFVW